MTVKKIIFPLIIALVLFLAISIIQSFFQTEEGRLKNIFFQAKRAAEKENLLNCISYVSFDYQDSYGNDRRNLMLIAKEVFDTYDKLRINIRNIDVSIEDNTAETEISAVVFGIRSETGEEERILEQDSGRFKVFFQKEEKGWKVIRIEPLKRDIYMDFRA